jgi:type IV fimbrial biogenesis protein FimT
MKKLSGLTILELLGVVALGSILFAVAVPSFTWMLRTNRLAAATNDLVGMLHYSRMEAVTRGRKVTLCKSSDGEQCANEGGFQQGWLVFVDENGNASHEADEEILRHVRLEDVGMTLQGNATVRDAITYSPAGAAVRTSGAFQAGTLVMCMAPEARRIILSRGGRVRIEADSC